MIKENVISALKAATNEVRPKEVSCCFNHDVWRVVYTTFQASCQRNGGIGKGSIDAKLLSI